MLLQTSRRGFLRSLAGFAALQAARPIYVLPPLNGWHEENGVIRLSDLINVSVEIVPLKVPPGMPTMEEAIQLRLMHLLSSTPRIPDTESGVALVHKAIEEVADRYVTAEVIVHR